VGQVDPLTPDTHQIHDFNPGINPFPNGLFWTIPISPDSVQVDLTSGTASYSVSNVAIKDWKQLANSFKNGASDDATVSFDMEWSGITSQYAVNDPNKGFAGAFMETGGTIVWSAKTAAGSFQSDAANTSKPSIAQLGRTIVGTPPAVVLSATPYYGDGGRYRAGPMGKE
jgi:hypothetical protein